MAIRKIVRVIKPAIEGRTYRGGLYRIIYASPEGIEYPSDVVKSKHDRLVFEQELLSRPITPADIEKYKKLLEAELHEEAEYNSNDYCPNCGM